MKRIRITKYIQQILTLTCLVMMVYVSTSSTAEAATITDCPTRVDQSYRDSANTLLQQKYWFSEYCRNNLRGVGPFSGGPYHVPSLSGGPMSWSTKPIHIPHGLDGVACDITDDEKAPHPQMSNYMLPKDCVDDGIDTKNFWVELRYDQSRDGVTSCTSGCAQNFNVRLQSGETYYHWHTATEFRAEIEGDRLCVYGFTHGVVESFVDCRKLPPPPPAAPPHQACWIAASCNSFAAIEHQWWIPVTALIAQCVTDTVNGIFANGRNYCPPGTPTAFERIQDNVRQTIRLVLTLFIIFVGYKVVQGEMHNKTEIMMLIVKFALVVYFTLAEGWQTYFTGLTGAANDLARIVFSGAIAPYDYCQFPDAGASPYAPGYQWMALWDTVDCKLYYYLGFREGGYPHLVMILIANLFGFAFFMVFMMVAFVTIFFKFIFYAVRAYVVAIFAIAILVYISPLMIPLSLFEATKSYFKKWLDELIGYVIYPMMLFAAVGMLVAVFDSIYWGEAQMALFDPTDGGLVIDCGGDNVSDQDLQTIMRNDPSYVRPASVDSMGCFIEHSAIRWVDIPLTSLEWPVVVDFHSREVMMAVLKACLFALIFAYFLEHLDQLIQAVTGTFRTAGGVMPKSPDKGDFAQAAVGGAVAGAGVVAQVGAVAMGGGGGGDGGASAAGGGGGAPTGAEGATGGPSFDGGTSATQGGSTQGGNTQGGNTQGGNTQGGNTQGGNQTTDQAANQASQNGQDSQARQDNQQQQDTDKDKKEKKEDRDDDKKKKKKKKGGDDEENQEGEGSALVGASAAESEEQPEDDGETSFFAPDEGEDDLFGPQEDGGNEEDGGHGEEDGGNEEENGEEDEGGWFMKLGDGQVDDSEI